MSGWAATTSDRSPGDLPHPPALALNQLALSAVPALYKWAIIAVMGTCRVRSTGGEHLRKLGSRGQPWVYCAWHNNIAMGVCLLRDRNLAMMASASHDGELIARAIEKLGNTAIRGSTSFRGGRAAREMVRALRRGSSGAMTPDGPRGPAYQCQTGAVWVAALSGCPLVPYHLEAERQWRIRSWDRHKIPKWFTVIHEHIGEPMFVTRDMVEDDGSAALAALQERMLANSRACLRAAGHPEGELLAAGS